MPKIRYCEAKSLRYSETGQMTFCLTKNKNPETLAALRFAGIFEVFEMVNFARAKLYKKLIKILILILSCH